MFFLVFEKNIFIREKKRILRGWVVLEVYSCSGMICAYYNAYEDE